MIRLITIVVLTVIAFALQATAGGVSAGGDVDPNANKKESPLGPGAPIQVEPDAQKKEAPHSRPATAGEAVRGWLAWLGMPR